MKQRGTTRRVPGVMAARGAVAPEEQGFESPGTLQASQWFIKGLDPDPAVRQLVGRVHTALVRAPAPQCLYYEEPAYGQPVLRFVTPTVLYEAGPIRDWILGLARELLRVS